MIGFEREYNEQPAGFRTHILVTLGATLFTLAGAYGAAVFAGEDIVRFDPTRVAAQVVTGIGFLGAGAILRQGVNIRGLTTAASIWVAASIGVAVALGYWTAAAFTTVLALGSLLFLRPIERAMVRSLRKSSVQIMIDVDTDGRLSQINAALDHLDVHVQRLKVIGDPGEHRQVVLSVNKPDEMEPDEIAARLQEVEGVTKVDWSRG